MSVATLQPSATSFGLLRLLLAGIVRAAAGTFGHHHAAQHYDRIIVVGHSLGA